MGTVSQRGSTWRARAGSAKNRQSATFDTEDEAWAWVNKIEERVREGDPRVMEKTVAFRVWMQKYIDESADQWKSGDDKKSRLRNLLADPIAAIPVNRLTPADFEKLRDRLLKEGRRKRRKGEGPGLKPQTVRHYLQDCSAVWEAARRKWKVTTLPNVLHDTDIPPVSKGRLRRVPQDFWKKALTRLKQHANPFYPLFAEFLYETAMRVHEPLLVRRQDVEWEGSILWVVGKGDALRCVPLSPRAIELLKKAIEMRERLPEVVGGRYDLSRYEKEKIWPLSYRGFYRAWCAARTAAGDSTAWIHDLRGERATQALESGMSTILTAIVTGHKDTRSLKDHYAAVEARRVARMLAEQAQTVR